MATTPDGKSSESKASIWQQRFENRKIKQKQMFEDAKKYYDIMYAVQNTTKISPWKSKVFVPVLASKAWDLIARMSDVVPLFDVTIKNELDEGEDGNIALKAGVLERQRRVEAKLHYDYVSGCDAEPMKLKVFDPLVDAVVAGTGYAYAHWVQKKDVKKGYEFDDSGMLTLDEQGDKTEVTKETETGHNGFEGINFFNVFVGDGPSFFKAPYVIVQGSKPLVDMKKSNLYQNLDNVDKTPQEDLELQAYNIARNRVVNEQNLSTIDESVETVTYFECYERTEKGIELTTYALGEADDSGENGWIEIRPTTVPYWHDMYPIVPFYARKKSYSVFGESLFENNRTLQSATNDLFNHYLDNWNLSIESMLMYEDGSLTNDFVVEPGGEITYTGEAPKQFKFPEPNPTQLSVVMNVLEKGIDAATFSPYATGTPNDQNDKTQGTKYGVQRISEAATTKIGFFRDNFKQSMKIVGRIWLSNLQQFSDTAEEIRRMENGKSVPDVVTPADYQGELELDIDDDSMTPLSKQDKREANQMFINDIFMQQKAAMNQAAIFKDVKDVPRYNFLEIFEDTAEVYSKKDYERYLLPNDIPIPQEQQQTDPKEIISFSYKDAPADIQAQIEQMFGLQPSAMHDTRLTHEAIKMGAEQAQIENGDPNGARLQPATQPGNPGAGATA